MAATASSEDIGELLGDVDDSIIARLVDTGATIDEIGEALDDLDHEHRFGERRPPSSAQVAAARAILEETFSDEDLTTTIPIRGVELG